jgi:hypothetical protein
MADQIHIQRKTVVNIRSLLRKMGLLDGAAIVQEKKGNGGEEGQDSRGASTTMGNGLPRDAVTGATGSHGITPGSSPDRTPPVGGQNPPTGGNGEEQLQGQERLVKPRARIVREPRDESDDSKIVGEMVSRGAEMMVMSGKDVSEGERVRTQRRDRRNLLPTFMIWSRKGSAILCL